MSHSSSSQPLAPAYTRAGVDIAAGEELVEKIRASNPTIGGFAGLFPLDDERFLVGCTDGVGTKIELSLQMNRLEDLGQDLVAMSVNDLIVCGARPLFFLDYFACGKLDVEQAHRVIKGIQHACINSNCVLLGGETAEMPGFYQPPKFDIAGFAVGEVHRSALIDGSTVRAGDVLVGLPSTGFHANGYSLVRKIIADKKLNLHERPDILQGQTLGEALTHPTALYPRAVQKVLAQVPVKAMAHITGGGLRNIQRVLPKGLTHHVDRSAVPCPPVIRFIAEAGDIREDEAFTVWNMGLGYVFVVDSKSVALLQRVLPDAFVCGEIIPE
ncbi:phosphoribosylformylglycinamidine cyclo-ligase [bacterium]|nr:phosphoribosylformylglycinamidine cyclo-ligase [bacterium]